MTSNSINMFTIDSRKMLYILFYQVTELKYQKKDNSNNYIYKNILDGFEDRKEIAAGKEGSIYQAKLFDELFTSIKIVDLQKLIETKNINKQVLDKTPEQIYDLFYSLETNTIYPSLIEIMSFTLTNQLVFQKKCPHFVLNYYWEYKDNKFIHYNEYINSDTLQNWAKEGRSEYEWTNILLQILFAIISMKKYFNMTHCDLYTKNILVQKVPKKGAWKYIINGKEYLLQNIGWVCLINDFGFTTIPDKMYVDWYFKRDLSDKSQREFELFDFNKLSYDLLSSKVFDNFKYSKKILIDSFNIVFNNNIEIMDATYGLYSWHFAHKYNEPINILNNQLIDTYNMDSPLNKEFLPSNLVKFSTF
jgi:hypothetical protein